MMHYYFPRKVMHHHFPGKVMHQYFLQKSDASLFSWENDADYDVSFSCTAAQDICTCDNSFSLFQTIYQILPVEVI